MLPYSLPIQGKTIENRTQKISPSFHSSYLFPVEKGRAERNAESESKNAF